MTKKTNDTAALEEKVAQLAAKYDLGKIHFDTECISCAEDMEDLVGYIVDELFPDNDIDIEVSKSEDGLHYIAVVKEDDAEMKMTADTESDFLPDVFFEQLATLPAVFDEGGLLCAVNPFVGLTGQDVMYFYGTEANIKAARAEGLPILLPGEKLSETQEYQDLIKRLQA